MGSLTRELKRGTRLQIERDGARKGKSNSKDFWSPPERGSSIGSEQRYVGEDGRGGSNCESSNGLKSDQPISNLNTDNSRAYANLTGLPCAVFGLSGGFIRGEGDDLHGTLPETGPQKRGTLDSGPRLDD